MESTRIPETTKSSREILKHVDQLVKSNNLEKALQEVKKARELDPKNLYAFAYEERIQELFIQQQRKKIDLTKQCKGCRCIWKSVDTLQFE